MKLMVTFLSTIFPCLRCDNSGTKTETEDDSMSYSEAKREKQLKSKATKVVVKEIRFGPQTDEHDYAFKKKHAEKFLKDGAKLKAFVFFKGRSIIYKDQGEILLLKLAQELEEFGKVEQLPKLESKKMIMIMSPKKSK